MRKDDKSDKNSSRTNEVSDEQLRVIYHRRFKKRLIRDMWIYGGIIVCFMPLHLQVTAVPLMLIATLLIGLEA